MFLPIIGNSEGLVFLGSIFGQELFYDEKYFKKERKE